MKPTTVDQKENGALRAFPHFLFCALLLILALFRVTDAKALGFRVPNEDPEAIARGNAFVATADNPSAVYYNPAGITQLEGQNVQLGLHAITINSFFHPAGGGDTVNSKFAVQPVPQFYLTRTLENLPLSFGVGMYAPYGLGLQWPVGSSFRDDSVFEGRLTYITLNPVIAWKVCDSLSIAAGPTINYSQVLLREGIPPMFGGEFKFRGDGYDFGFTSGILWHPVPKWSFGASYHSATSIKYGGSSSTYASSTAATATVPFGQFVIAGVSYRPTTNWNVEVDVDWTDWSRDQTVYFHNTPLAPNGDVPFALNWKPTFMVGLGATRYLKNGYFVSAGYFFSENSTSDHDFTPIVPDTDLHVGSVGFGHHGEHWSWALAAQLIMGPERNISDDSNPAVDGKYQWINGSLNASIRYHF